MPITELLKSGAGGVEYLGNSDKNHFFRVPVAAIKTHDDFSKIRAKDPDRTLLRASMEQTDGPVYPIAVYIEETGDGIKIYVADGHQRLQAAKDNDDEFITAIWRETWVDVESTLKEIVSTQYARYEMTDLDRVSLIRTGKMTQSEVARETGEKESKISRLAKIAKHDWLTKAVLESKIIPLSQATKMIDACQGNSEKLNAIKTTYEKKFAVAKAEANYQANLMKTKNRKWTSKDRQKAKPEYYFKGTNWASWIDTVAADDGIVDGKLNLNDSVSAAKNPVTIGSPDEWQKTFALEGLFGSKIDDVATEDVKHVLKHWDKIGAALQAVIDEKPVPAIENTVFNVVRPEPPATQNGEMEPEPVSE